MKLNSEKTKWLPSLLAGLALAASTGVSQAGNNLISHSFDSGIDGWVINYATGDASATWNSTAGVDGGGGYGNLQTVMRDATWSWDNYWFGAMDSSYNAWKHISVTIPPLPV